MGKTLAYSPNDYCGMTARVKVRLPHPHMVMVHMDCGGIVDPGEQYYDWFAEDVNERQYCHGCECDLSLTANVEYITAHKRAQLFKAVS